MKQSIQKHDISNLSPLAPALRGLEDARTQRWTVCEPCSMEQNVQVYKENIVNMERPSNTFGKMRKCQNTEIPRPQCWQWAWIENLVPSQIVEHVSHVSHWARSYCPGSTITLSKFAIGRWRSRSLNTAKMIHDKFIVKKIKHTDTIETVNTARLHDQWNGRLSTCLLKASLAHEKSAARWKNTKKHTFDLNIQYFWSRAREIPKMSFGNLKAGIFEPSWRPRNVKE